MRPTAHYHGHGWRALLEQAEYLEQHPNEHHALVVFDAIADDTREIFLETPGDVRSMAKHLRHQAHIWRQRERAGLN